MWQRPSIWPQLIIPAGLALACSAQPTGPAAPTSEEPHPADNTPTASATTATPDGRRSAQQPDVALAPDVERADHSTAVLPIDVSDPVWGNTDAPVTIVEFLDFECPFSARVNPMLAEIRRLYGPDKVRFVWKHHPLPFHKTARPAHEAAAAIQLLAGSEAFWDFHDLAFANRKALTTENFIVWASEVGVDAAKFKAELGQSRYSAKVDIDIAVARRVGVRGTPSFRINGVALSGARPLATFKEVIDEQLAEAKKLTDAGTPPAEVYVQLVEKSINEKAQADAVKAIANARRERESQDSLVWAIPVFDDDPKRGAADALVTIVKFSEFQCPFCQRVLPTETKILESFGKDVRIVWKDNPLRFHPRALPAANAARAVYDAKGDDAFWQAHDRLFGDAQRKHLTDAAIQDALADSGVPWNVIRKAMTTNRYAEKFEQSQAIAVDFAARGTPHFFVNGVRLAGAQPFPAFERVIKDQLAKAKLLESRGIARAKIYDEILKTGEGPPPPKTKRVPAAPQDSPFLGNSRAPIVIQAFMDFECPFSARVQPTLKQVMARHGQDVKLVWRNLPLSFHKHAHLTAEAAYEVYRQKGNWAFWQYRTKLFAVQRAPGGLQRDNLERLAAEVGADMPAFVRALDQRTHQDRIDADMAVAQAASISGTPGFVINGYYLSGAQPYSAFKALIQRAKSER